jgi:Winged helix DNA-binding domain
VRSGCSLAAVEAAFDAGSIVRAWPLRGTLHLLSAQDLSWLRELLAPRQLARAALHERRLGLDAQVITRAAEVVIETLSVGGPSSRAELNRAWAAAEVDSSGERSYHLIWHLAHTGTIVLGPTRGGQQLFALSETWLPASHELPRADALALLARRYFGGHGPATAADLARWANLTAADTREAVAAARPQLSVIAVDGTEYLLGPETEDLLAGCREQAAAAVIALPHFDELLFGYRDRTPTLPAEHDAVVFASRNGVPACTVVHRGEVVATWRRTKKGAEEAFTPVPLIAKPKDLPDFGQIPWQSLSK